MEVKFFSKCKQTPLCKDFIITLNGLNITETLSKGPLHRKSLIHSIMTFEGGGGGGRG